MFPFPSMPAMAVKAIHLVLLIELYISNGIVIKSPISKKKKKNQKKAYLNIFKFRFHGNVYNLKIIDCTSHLGITNFKPITAERNHANNLYGKQQNRTNTIYIFQLYLIEFLQKRSCMKEENT